jgi:hypothetical protein
MFWHMLKGMSRPALRIEVTKGSERAGEDAEQRRSAGAGGAARNGIAATGERRQCAAYCRVHTLTAQAMRKVGHRYIEGGFERAVYEKERPGATSLLEDGQKRRIIAMVCAAPPEGHARWTVRLIAEQAIKRRLVPRIGRETIRILLLSHDLKPWLKKNVWCAEMNRSG